MIDKLKIATFLKTERKRLNLTQSEFVKNVLSTSQYSRIENGKQTISVTNLVSILKKNKIDIDIIFNTFPDSIQVSNSKQMPERQLLELILQCLYSQDLVAAQSLRSKVEDSTLNNSLKLKMDIIIQEIKDSVNNLSNKKKKEISNELNKSDNWARNNDFLQLLALSMKTLNMERINIYIREILLTYRKTISKEPIAVQKIIANVCVNYLIICHKENNYLYVNETLDLLKGLSVYPELMVYKILQEYFNSLFNNKEGIQKEICNFLKKIGYKKLVEKIS